MKTLRTGLFILSFFGVIAVQAQSVDEIVTKHINALGGKAVIEKTNSVYVESTVSVNGNDVPAITYILIGKGSRTDVNFNGQKFIQSVSEKGAWAVAPGGTGATALPDEVAKASRMQYEMGGPLYNYAAKGSKVTLAGKDSSGDYRLDLTTKDGLAVTYFINAKTFYIDKAVNKVSMGGQDIQITAVYSDYRKTDQGYVIAWAQENILPQVTMDVKNTKVEVNKSIDETLFDMPK